MCDEPTMPDDWDDHLAWETYYRDARNDEFLYEDTVTDPGSFTFNRLDSLIDDLRSRSCTTLWFPGCGLSPLPRVLAAFGFGVLATDIAPAAIEHQQGNQQLVQSLIAQVPSTISRAENGSVKALVHDCRTSIGEHLFDAIFNVKSIQGFATPSMRDAVAVHFAALRPGGIAFFDTMNVQGERRDQLESMLTDAGFYVPLHKLNRWYRKTLRETGIPHMFVLGSPMIPQRQDMPYPHQRGSAEHIRDTQTLRDITNEYRSRMESEYQQEQACVDRETKLSEVIYSTG